MSSPHIAEIDRARRAAEIVDDPLYREAFEAVRAELMREWAATAAHETERRERVWQASDLLGRVQSHLAEIMTTGRLAKLQLEREESRMQRVTAAVRRAW